MGVILSYSITSAIVLAVLYLTYKWVLAAENYHRLNRAVLWGIYIVSLVIGPITGVVHGLLQAPVTVPAVAVDIGMPVALDVVESGTAGSGLTGWLLVLYAAGVIAVTAMTAWNLWRLISIIGRGRLVEMGEFRMVLTSDNGVAPFSFGRYIVISERDFNESGSMIFAHERSHVELRHWVDLLMAQAVCVMQWFNPAAWLMREEFKNVHEYQADRRVISSGVNIKEYQRLLIRKAVGARFPSLANSLNHSKLKKRITMMYNQKCPRRRTLRALALLPAIGVALWVTRIPIVASAVMSIGEAAMPLPVSKGNEIGSSKQADGSLLIAGHPSASAQRSVPSVASEAVAGEAESSDFPQPDVMPEFTGGMQALMQFLSDNIVYPKQAGNVSGRVVVRFVVDRDGSVKDPEIVRSVNPLLDAEALRVVSMLPDFTPGRAGNDPVAVEYSLPISFKSYEPSAPSTTGVTEPNTMTVTSVDENTGHRTTYSTSTSKSISTSNSSDGATVTTTTTVLDNGTTATTVINDSGSEMASVTVVSSDGKTIKPEIYIDGRLYNGDIKAIPSSKIAGMNIDRSSDRVRIDITTKR